MDIRTLIKQDRFDAKTEAKMKHALGTDQITYPNILGDYRDYQKFLIVSRPRSGSTFLAGLLRSHPHVVCYNELLLPKRCPFIYPFFPDSEDPRILSIRNKDTIRFLKDYIYRGYLDNFKAVGFKVHYGQLMEKENARAFAFFRRNRKIRIIHLIRKNFLRTYISRLTALATDQWSLINPELLRLAKQEGLDIRNIQEIQPRVAPPLVLDAEELRHYFEASEEEMAYHQRAFRKHPSILVHYEDLATDLNAAASPLLDFLGAEDRILSSFLVKQNTRPLEEIVANYRELESRFSGTKWAAFFNE